MWYIHTMAYYLAILKEWNIDTGYNMDEPWKHWAKWKKPVTDHILYDCIYVECPE